VRRLVVGTLLTALTAGLSAAAGDDGLRSELYPADWRPGTADEEGRFLHDFSYAGYRYGRPVPQQVPGDVVDVTDPPYRADPSGERDATAAIQAAIDDVGDAGGGTVHLPAGTYLLDPPEDSRAALHVADDGVLLRGEGPDRTRLVTASASGMRQAPLVLVAPERERQYWDDSEESAADVVPLTRDVTTPTRTLHVADPEPFAVGDWVVLKADTTRAWLREHPVDEDEEWDEGTLGALVYHRRVTAVDAAAGTVEVDVPTRYPMLRRDGLRLHHHPAPVQDSGVAHLAVGMAQSERSGLDEEDFDRRGSAGRQVHQAAAITFNNVVHGWVDDVRSVRPPGNDDDVHLLSVGVYVRDARQVTVQGTDLRHPQYRGAGGNGYLYHLMGSDTLVRDAHAEGGRHNYLVQGVQATGNVVLDSRSVDGERASELHRHLSAANLFDNLAVDGDTLEMRYRDVSTHAHSATESVMWNVAGEDCTRGRLAVSQQLGWGYVVGTSGSGDCARVENPGGDHTEPRDWLEHVGDGERLEPRSLYLDQLARRTGSPTATPTDRATVTPAVPEDDGVTPAALLAAVAGGALLLAAVALVLVHRRRGRERPRHPEG